MPKTINDVYVDEMLLAMDIASRLRDVIIDQFPAPNNDECPVSLATANHATKIRMALEEVEKCICESYE